jgi:pyruvate dehydrogenase (quinone)
MSEQQDQPTVSDHVVERLTQWGTERIYGYAGDGINNILGALNRNGNRPEFIHAPHEELCALMACAHAKFTGEVGVCLATQGPGAIHLLNGLYDANLDHQPVVAIVGEPEAHSDGSHFQQEVDLPALFKDVAGAYCHVVSSPAQVRHALDTAMRIARGRRTVTCLIIPHDVQRAPAVAQPPHEHGAMHSAVGHPSSCTVPVREDLQRAAEVLNSGKRVAILAGAGALNAGDQVAAVADKLGAGVAKALLGKSVLPDALPFVTGTVGWLGTSASNQMMAACDTLLMIGSGFPYTEFLPQEGQARGVQIDIDPGMLSLRYPMEVNLEGDSRATLEALLPLLQRKPDETWRRQIAEWKTQWTQQARDWAMQEGKALNPQRVFLELSPKLPDRCIVAADCGSSTVWYGRYLDMRPGMLASLSGTLATMGSAVPYALAAKFTHPDRPVIAIAGDGAMQMNGINALISVAQYWRRWSDPRVILLVLNNRDLNYVTWEQRVMEGEPKFPASQDLPDFPYAHYAQLLGLAGLRMESAGDVARVWDQALALDRPVVIEAVTDADVPTLPPRLKPEQEQKLRRALASGDPDAQGVLEKLQQQGLMTP